MGTQATGAETGLVRRDEMAGMEVSRSAETAMGALAAQMKAEVEARFMVAYRCPRDWDDVRVRINRLCQDPEFAAEALYVKPMGRTPDGWKEMSKRDQLLKSPEDWPTGFSIRFVEAAIYEATNIDVDVLVTWEDAEVRRTRVSVFDLQSNNKYSRTITTRKIVERRRLKDGQESLGTRTNSSGITVYLVEATDADVTQMESAAVSKVIRTYGEKLLPPHHKREWQRKIWDTLSNQAAKDPQGEMKKLIDLFADRNITPRMLEDFLGHPVSQIVPAEIVKLRGVFVAINNAEATWADVVSGPPQEGQKPTAAQTAILERIEAQRRKAAQPTAEQPETDKTEKQEKQATESFGKLATDAPALLNPPAQPAQSENTAPLATASGQGAPPAPAGGNQPVQEAAQPATTDAAEKAEREVEELRQRNHATSQPQQQAAPQTHPPASEQNGGDIPTYTRETLPVEGLKAGQECYFEGKLLRALIQPGDPVPQWKTVGKAPASGDPPRSAKKQRNIGSLGFE